MQFYDHEGEFVDGVGSYLVEAVFDGASAVVIATLDHREALVGRLEEYGIDTARAVREGILVLHDAATLLERFMPGGVIDRHAFFDVVGGVIREAARDGRRVRAFGEMVAVLWEAGDVLAAIDIEALWNDLGAELPFTLYCAYRTDTVAGHEHSDALNEVCSLHGTVLSSADDEGVVTASYPVDPACVAEARRMVAAAARRWGHERMLVTDAELVASELAGNALLHARTPWEISVHRYGPMMQIAVRDGSHDLPAVLPPDPARESGRGMHLIDKIARRWGVDVDEAGKTVWAQIGR